MEKTKIKNENAPRGVVIACRVIALVFAFFALAQLLTAVVSPLNAGIAGVIFHLVLSGLFVFGFWRMEKWIILLSAVMSLFLIINSGTNVFSGTRSFTGILLPIFIMVGIFIFTYFSRAYLKGKYINVTAIAVLVATLLLSKFFYIFFN